MKRTGELLRYRGVEPYNIVLPLPQSELDVNPGLRQNPGY
jgi:hypothetical protein